MKFFLNTTCVIIPAVLFTALLLCGCSGNTTAPEVNITKGEAFRLEISHPVKFTYEGHSYISWETCPTDFSRAVVHDPECLKKDLSSENTNKLKQR